MKIPIKVKVHAREDKIEVADDGSLIVYVTEAPEKGRANRAIIKLLAEYYDVPTTRIGIVRGHTSARKLIEVID